MTRLAVLIGFVVCSVSIQPLQAEEGCPFLSNAEVEELTGRKLELFKLTSMTLPDGAGTLCDSEIARVIVLFGENSTSRLDDMMKEFGRDREERLPISGLGEKAYAVHLEPRTEYESPTALIVVTSELYTASVSVRAKEGEPAKSAQPQALELLKIAISRIQ